jgi:hypothetical protein
MGRSSVLNGHRICYHRKVQIPLGSCACLRAVITKGTRGVYEAWRTNTYSDKSANCMKRTVFVPGRTYSVTSTGGPACSYKHSINQRQRRHHLAETLLTISIGRKHRPQLCPWFSSTRTLPPGGQGVLIDHIASAMVSAHAASPSAW